VGPTPSTATAQPERALDRVDVDEPTGARFPRWTIVALVGACALMVASASVVRTPKQDDRFCDLGLALVAVDGGSYPLQDQGVPGPDPCDLPRGSGENGTGGNVGYDCRVHFAVGVVSEPVMAPNRPDGTCGQAEP
jgi:hypothetical protein